MCSHLRRGRAWCLLGLRLPHILGALLQKLQDVAESRNAGPRAVAALCQPDGGRELLEEGVKRECVALDVPLDLRECPQHLPCLVNEI